MVSGTELNDLKDILNLLKPLELVTKEVSGQEYITSSKVIPLVHTLENIFGNLEVTSEIMIQVINKEIKQISAKKQCVPSSRLLKFKWNKQFMFLFLC